MREQENDIITFEPLTLHETEILRAFRIICERDPKAAAELVALVQSAVACLPDAEIEV